MTQAQFCVIGYCPCGAVFCISDPVDFATACVTQLWLRAQHPGKPVTIAITINNRTARAQRAELLSRSTTQVIPGQVVTTVQTFPGKAPVYKTEPLPPPSAEGGAL